MDAEYEILTVPSANTYTIQTSAAATSTGTSSETATATYQLSVGTAVSQYGYGWGTYQWAKKHGARLVLHLMLLLMDVIGLLIILVRIY